MAKNDSLKTIVMVLVIIILLVVSAFAVVMAYQAGIFGFMGLTPGDVQDDAGDDETPVEIEGKTLAYLKTWVVSEDDTTDDLESEDVYIWYDWNGDGQMQRSAFAGFTEEDGLIGGEIEHTSTGSSDGYFTSRNPYPVGESIWVFVDPGSDDGYQKSYQKVIMYGSPDSNNQITTANVLCRATDDAITFSGLIRNTAIDDGTDYNYTANGQTGAFEIRATLATSKAGFDSQVADSPTYNPSNEYWVHWGTGKKYAPTFLGGYCTNQDAVDLGIDAGDWDFYYQGATNTYFARYLMDFDDYSEDSDTIYYSAYDAAPTWVYSTSVDISAAGAVVYVGIFQDVEWSDFNRGTWNPTTDANIIGTCGADWDWVA
ncbi:MAG: hypothetical protein GF411_12980 [Candidatus Lokiarchaeota archaeon]|nr:hypothetical protein [Candidatus Lokiarchaeota archaeon]